MLRDDADFFSTRYDDMVREPDATWRTWVADAASGAEKTLFVAEEQGHWLGVVGAFTRVNPLEVQLISMWVDPSARGRGVAQRLIRAVALWANGRGSTPCRPVRAGSEHSGAAAVRTRRLQADR